MGVCGGIEQVGPASFSLRPARTFCARPGSLRKSSAASLRAYSLVGPDIASLSCTPRNYFPLLLPLHLNPANPPGSRESAHQTKMPL